jgi:cell division topological specificity factor
MSIFSRLYNRYRKPSKVIAKERLRLVLVHDRAGISPEVLHVIKNEIIAIISKHVRVDRDGIEVNLSHQKGHTRLVANIPIVNSRSTRLAGPSGQMLGREGG